MLKGLVVIGVIVICGGIYLYVKYTDDCGTPPASSTEAQVCTQEWGTCAWSVTGSPECNWSCNCVGTGHLGTTTTADLTQ